MATINFKQQVWEYYFQFKRSFLWRQNIDPYVIYVSEIMLQQTQTSRVAKLLPGFLALFPNFWSIAESNVGQIISAWQGLGYNRRALNLWNASKIICDQYSGIIPADRVFLESLPGIGINTAGAILCYAFNRAEPFIETNIRSVYLHHFYNEVLQNNQINDKQILAKVQETIDMNNPREWFWALMDYGVYIKKNIGNISAQVQGQRKQSSFKGSLREVRGKILKILATNPQAISAIDLKQACGELADHRYEEALQKLMRDGMIVAEHNNYHLP